MLAHELRRRMAAVRVVSEAIAVRSSSGDDLQRMLGLLHGEVDDWTGWPTRCFRVRGAARNRRRT